MGKTLSVLLLAAALFTVGCGKQTTGTAGQTTEGAVLKAFFARTVIYTVEAGARENMAKLENLVARAQKLEPPLPDDAVLPLYRDADVNRDHRITAKEADAFYKEYVLRFEDALGLTKY